LTWLFDDINEEANKKFVLNKYKSFVGQNGTSKLNELSIIRFTDTFFFKNNMELYKMILGDCNQM